MNDKYWSDYTDFLNKVQALWQHSPANLLEFYTDLVVALENEEDANYTFFEFEYENDFNYRMIIQEIIDYPGFKNNLLKDEFEVNVSGLDSRMIKFLTDDCANRADWYKNIDLKPYAT